MQQPAMFRICQWVMAAGKITGLWCVMFCSMMRKKKTTTTEKNQSFHPCLHASHKIGQDDFHFADYENEGKVVGWLFSPWRFSEDLA